MAATHLHLSAIASGENEKLARAGKSNRTRSGWHVWRVVIWKAGQLPIYFVVVQDVEQRSKKFCVLAKFPEPNPFPKIYDNYLKCDTEYIRLCHFVFFMMKFRILTYIV